MRANRGDMKGFYLLDKAHVLLTTSYDNSAAVWNTVSGRRIINIPAKVFSYGTWNEKNKRLVTLSEEGTCLLWDLATGAKVATIGHPFETEDKNVFILYRGSVGRVVTRSRSGTVELWDSADGHKIADLDPATPVSAVNVNSEVMRVAAIPPSGEFALFDAPPGAMVVHVAGPPRILGFSFSGDGKRLIPREIENRLQLRNAITGAELGYIGSSNGSNYSFSRNGQLILLRSSGGGADLLRADNGQLLLRFADPSLKTFEFSASGDRLTVTDYAKQATLWDVSEGDRSIDQRRIALLSGSNTGTTEVDDTTFSAD